MLSRRGGAPERKSKNDKRDRESEKNKKRVREMSRESERKRGKVRASERKMMLPFKGLGSGEREKVNSSVSELMGL